MRRKSVLLVAICSVIVALLLTSCGSAITEEESVPIEEGEVVTEKEEDTEEKEENVREEAQVTAPSAERPTYGGWLNACLSSDPAGFDEAIVTHCFVAYSQHVTNEHLFTGDITRGPSGTGETSWVGGGPTSHELQVPLLAEGWEMPDEETVVYHIRKGVRFHNKPPVNGREMTAHDVAFSVKRLYESPRSYLYLLSRPWAPESITAPDKWTVVVEWPQGAPPSTMHWLDDFAYVVPHEMIEEYGDLQDWRNACGTGPYILTDYVAGSCLTYERNPTYWRKDPFHPENTLPYPDGVQQLVIKDLSTRLAALRTGKIDRLAGIGWEDAAGFRRTSPELRDVKELSYIPYYVYMRVDKPELPFYDIKIRRALAMAIDRQAIAEQYYGGEAEVLGYPAQPRPEHAAFFTPLDELPESVQELFSYNPEKAKALLAEAGYPDGFKTEIVCTQSNVDALSLIKAYWTEIGVDLKLDVKESGVVTSMAVSKSHKEMFYRYRTTATWSVLVSERPGFEQNLSMIDDQRINETFERWQTLEYFLEPSKVHAEMKELVPYVLDNCWMIQFPVPYTHTMWWPWLKQYNGESMIGEQSNNENWIIYPWIDQDLKETMGH